MQDKKITLSDSDAVNQLLTAMKQAIYEQTQSLDVDSAILLTSVMALMAELAEAANIPQDELNRILPEYRRRKKLEADALKAEKTLN